jgi:hypothetical protein
VKGFWVSAEFLVMMGYTFIITKRGDMQIEGGGL